jgi:hypothetical protein
MAKKFDSIRPRAACPWFPARRHRLLDLDLRFDPVALPLDQTAELKATNLKKEKNLTLRPSPAQNAQGLAAKGGQGVCDSLRGVGRSSIATSFREPKGRSPLVA